MKDTQDKFRTPPRIIIPVLVKSRDQWKDKAQERNRILKSAQIRIRDLATSRECWKQRALDAEAQLHILQEQLAQAQLLLAQAPQQTLVRPDEKK